MGEIGVGGPIVPLKMLTERAGQDGAVWQLWAGVLLAGYLAAMGWQPQMPAGKLAWSVQSSSVLDERVGQGMMRLRPVEHKLDKEADKA